MTRIYYEYSLNIADFELATTHPCSEGIHLFNQCAKDNVLQMTESEILAMLPTKWNMPYRFGWLLLLLELEVEKEILKFAKIITGKYTTRRSIAGILVDHMESPDIVKKLIRLCMVYFYRHGYATRQLVNSKKKKSPKIRIYDGLLYDHWACSEGRQLFRSLAQGHFVEFDAWLLYLFLKNDFDKAAMVLHWFLSIDENDFTGDLDAILSGATPYNEFFELSPEHFPDDSKELLETAHQIMKAFYDNFQENEHVGFSN